MTVLFTLLLSVGAYAQHGHHNDHLHVETIIPNAPLQLNGECTDWVKAKGSSCVLANAQAEQMWRRKCSHPWDEIIFCWDENPNELEMVCTPWYRETSVSCKKQGEKAYSRWCGDVRYKKHYCFKTNPNTIE